MAGFKHALLWAGHKFTYSVLDDIWPLVMFFSSIATMVCCVSHFTSINLGINSVMLTVLGTIVSLIVSFKTNSSYGRWWDGRNVWSNLTSHSRQLAMLLWLQIPNAPPSKPDDKGVKAANSSGEKDTNATAHASPTPSGLDFSSPHGSRTVSDEDGTKSKQDEEEELKARLAMQGLIDKKTYIGLVQAFSVAIKHALRGEAGPFYSDLYHLIAFLPKYNPSAYPPITRGHIMALWQNGLPREKAGHFTDVVAVPLSTAIAFRGDALNQRNLPDPFLEHEKGFSTDGRGPDVFREQAIQSASSFVVADDPNVFALNRQRSKVKHVQRRQGAQRQLHSGGSDGPSQNEGITLATVELMPPRHPPVPKIWDFIPPLRIFKIIYDWFRYKSKGKDNERSKGGKRKRVGAPMEIPQEIIMYLSAYLSDVISRGLINASLISPCMTSLMELQKAVSDLEKVATTPIPSAYTFHLRLTVYTYLFFLPFQVYNALGWLTIPATAIAATIYLGFLEIGVQIEMPFGYDQSDLDLDKFVLRLAHQIAQITAFPTALPASHVILSHLNQPFLPSLGTSAPDLLGIPERQPRPTEKGFAHAFCSYDCKHASKESLRLRTPTKGKRGPAAPLSDHAADHTDDEIEREAEEIKPRPLLRSMRDIEMVLNANYREIVAETDDFIGKPRDQLENRTGLEVAVLTL
ncbi:hypothetical protein IAU60_000764 [Kwoniella sp. DSM 27419]